MKGNNNLRTIPPERDLDTAKKKKEEETIKKAAYALNMCTVSVAQIVDYNDEYILEQIPKDEALLNILTELLNTITFFRIQEIKKKQIEKEYNRRLSNAIWSAVPNIGLIVAGGNPVTMAISLASQVGIGYMNYRKERANAAVDRDKEKVELQITAIEQFNAIKRELFTTAWRLADTHHFPDEYRLTEKQIKQYNLILMDRDELRKYERLEAIQENFHAYPPFWYFFGHTANYIAGAKAFNLDEETRKKYQDLAKEHFETYAELNKLSILREDQIAASCMLEYADLLLLEETPDHEKISGLLREAVKKSGNANDVLQLCALTYIRIGKTEEAAPILKILVNEDYNRSTNARLLSRIYVSRFLQSGDREIRTEYDILSMRVDTSCHFPMPEEEGVSDEQLQAAYMAEQRSLLQREYRYAFGEYVKQYAVKANRILALPAKSENIGDDYYSDDPAAKSRRDEDAKKALTCDNKEQYIAEFGRENFRKQYIDLLNHMLCGLDSLSVFSADADEKTDMLRALKSSIYRKQGQLAAYQSAMDNRMFSVDMYRSLQTDMALRTISKGFMDQFKAHMVQVIDSSETNAELETLAFEIESFCLAQNIDLSKISVSSDEDTKRISRDSGYLRYAMLGSDVADMADERYFQELCALAKDMTNQIIVSAHAAFYVHGDEEFKTYFKNSALSRIDIRDDTIAILDDKSKKDLDLLLTRKGFVIVRNNKVQALRDYARISYVKYKNKETLQLGWPDTFANDSVCIGMLYSLIEQIEEKLLEET